MRRFVEQKGKGALAELETTGRITTEEFGDLLRASPFCTSDLKLKIVCSHPEGIASVVTFRLILLSKHGVYIACICSRDRHPTQTVKLPSPRFHTRKGRPTDT